MTPQDRASSKFTSSLDIVIKTITILSTDLNCDYFKQSLEYTYYRYLMYISFIDSEIRVSEYGFAANKRVYNVFFHVITSVTVNKNNFLDI